MPGMSDSPFSSAFVSLICGVKPIQTLEEQMTANFARAMNTVSMAIAFNTDFLSVHLAGDNMTDHLNSEVKLLNEVTPASRGHLATDLERALFAELCTRGCFDGRGFDAIKKTRRVSIFVLFGEILALDARWDVDSKTWVAGSPARSFFPRGWEPILIDNVEG